MLNRGGANQQIRVRDQETFLAQLSPDTGKAAHDRLGEGQHGNGAEELAKDPLTLFGISADVNALIDLAVGNQTDGKTRCGQGGEKLDCW